MPLAGALGAAAGALGAVLAFGGAPFGRLKPDGMAFGGGVALGALQSGQLFVIRRLPTL